MDPQSEPSSGPVSEPGEPTDPVQSEPAPSLDPEPTVEPESGPMPEPVAPEPSPASQPEAVPEPEPESSTAAPTFSKRRLLAAIGTCSVQHYEAFTSAAESLATATQAHAETLQPEAQLAMLQAWLDAMLLWQRAELFQFGPAALTSEPGGLGLRDHIYAWNGNPPGNNRCRIEQRIVSRDFTSPDFPNSLIVTRTLSAFEFLAFHSSTDTACTSFDDIVAQGSWAALSETERAQNRADYASAIAKDVSARAAALRDAWSPNGGAFQTELELAGNGGTLFGSQQQALNAVADALFYLDKQVKDWKLGMPLGLVPECPKASCPEAFESQYARISTLELYENLLGFEDLFRGCGGDETALGFDDWLMAVGAEDLAARMTAALDEAIVLVGTLDPPLEDALAIAPDEVLAVHAAVKVITDLLKAEFVTVLNLELPSAVATDND